MARKNLFLSLIWLIALLPFIPPFFTEDLWLFKGGIFAVFGLILIIIFMFKDEFSLILLWENGGNINSSNKVILFIFSVLAFLFIHSLFQINPFLAFRRLGFLAGWALIMMAFTTIYDHQQKEKILGLAAKIIAYSAFIASLISLVFFVFPIPFQNLPNLLIAGWSNRWNMLAGFEYNKNFQASFLVMALPFSFWVFRSFFNKLMPNKATMPLVLIVLAPSLFVISSSGGASLALALGLMALLIMLYPEKRRAFMLSSASVLGFIALLWFFDKPADFWELSDRLHRMVFWQTTFITIKENPVFGIGLDHFAILSPKIHAQIPAHNSQPSIYAHNEFLQLWSELGIFGLLAAVFLIYGLYKMIFFCQFANSATRSGFDIQGGAKIGPEDAFPKSDGEISQMEGAKIGPDLVPFLLMARIGIIAFFAHALVSYPSFMPQSMALLAFFVALVLGEKYGSFLQYQQTGKKWGQIAFVLLLALICSLNPLASISNFYGQKLRRLGFAQDAGLYYSLSLLFRYDDPVARNGIAQAYLSMNMPQAAISEYDMALKYNPYRSVILFNKGCALLDIQEYESALSVFLSSQDLMIKHYERALCHFNIGICYENLGQYQPAILAYQESAKLFFAIMNFDDSIKALMNLSLLLFNNNDFEKAEKGFARILEIQPNNKKAMEFLDILSHMER